MKDREKIYYNNENIKQYNPNKITIWPCNCTVTLYKCLMDWYWTFKTKVEQIEKWCSCTPAQKVVCKQALEFAKQWMFVEAMDILAVGKIDLLSKIDDA